MEHPASISLDGSGTRREIHAREREIWGSSAILEVMKWNEITDRVWHEREEDQSRTGEEEPTHKEWREEEELGVVRDVGGKPAGSGLTEAEAGKSRLCTGGAC